MTWLHRCRAQGDRTVRVLSAPQRYFAGMPEARRVVTGATVLGVLLALMAPVAAEAPETAPTALQRVVARLGEEARSFDRAAIVGISVERLDTGEIASYQGDQFLKAASGLKQTWMAAAVRAVGIDAVELLAPGVFQQSSNKAGGRAIAMGGGLDAVNRFTAGLGMSGTLVVEWTFGGDWRAEEYPGPHPALNFTSADDLVAFWRLMHDGWILSRADTATFLEWGRLERLSGYSSGLLSRLPEDLRDHVSFKMGWLPPGRTEEDEETGEITEVDALDSIIGSGLVDVPGGPTYAIAIGAFGGENWPRKVAFVSYAACRIHETISGDDLECDRSGDPHRTRADSDPPIGGLEAVAGDADFVRVRGWAVDPDDISQAVLVRFTLDGFWTGSTRAIGRTSWGGDAQVVEGGHDFQHTLLADLAPGTHEVCAVALNDGSGPNTPIGCMDFDTR